MTCRPAASIPVLGGGPSLLRVREIDTHVMVPVRTRRRDFEKVYVTQSGSGRAQRGRKSYVGKSRIGRAKRGRKIYVGCCGRAKRGGPVTTADYCMMFDQCSLTGGEVQLMPHSEPVTVLFITLEKIFF